MPDESPAGRRGGAVEAVERIINRECEADEILRQSVATIAKRFDTFCGIRFVEDGGMIDGPSGGAVQRAAGRRGDHLRRLEHRRDRARQRPLEEEDRDAFDRIAELLSPFCLVGWDTGGEAWNP